MRQAQVVRSRYLLESSLGSGGFSEVWLARDLATGAAVALKLPRAGSDAAANKKIEEEAAILRNLDHPNIVRVLDSFRDEGREFLVMELVEGQTLRDVLRESGAMSDRDVLAMGASLADALAVAHRRGFVHGDVKPENIIISSGLPYLIDFGTARNLADTLAPEELRAMAGTLAYLAPELLTGVPVSPQSDVFSLAVTLYEARSGRLPFAAGGTLAGSEGRRASPLRYAVPGVDPGLESAIMQSLAIDPAWRPGTAAELLEQLTSGRHDTVQLSPQPVRDSSPAGVLGNRPTVAAEVAVGASASLDLSPAVEASTFQSPDEWSEFHSAPRSFERLAMVMALAAMLLLAAFATATVLRPGSGESSPTAGYESAVEDAAAPETSIAAASVTATRTPALTPSLTATPTVEPPTATSAPPTPTVEPPTATSAAPIQPPTPSTDRQQMQPQLDTQSGARRVLQWYELVVVGRFDEAYALWSDRMKADFPRQGNLDHRWANTVNVSVNDVRVASQSGDRMTVLIDFVETQADGSSRRFVGSWYLVASNNGWLLDAPSF